MMRLCTIASGSSANCTLLWGDSREVGDPRASFAVLVDAGVGVRKIKRALDARGIPFATVTDIFITHEHIDHIRGLPALLGAHPHLRVWGTEKTLRAIRGTGVTMANACTFTVGETLGHAPTGGALAIRTIPIDHDAADPVGYRFDWTPARAHNAAAAVVTDLGHARRDLAEALDGVTALVFESNHCEEMLRLGPYPALLKKRIAGKHGHLSNKQSAEFLSRLVGGWPAARDAITSGATALTIARAPLDDVVLAHLSEVNNTHALARDTNTTAIAAVSTTTRVHVAPRHDPSETIVVRYAEASRRLTPRGAQLLPGADAWPAVKRGPTAPTGDATATQATAEPASALPRMAHLRAHPAAVPTLFSGRSATRNKPGLDE